MPAEIVMPHMGESVAEGTILKWLKSPGDRVEEDEPVVEVGTDKIDVEIPSPRAGVLLEILAEKGDTVEVDQKLATVGEEGEAPDEAPPTEEEKKEAEEEKKKEEEEEQEEKKTADKEEAETKPRDEDAAPAATKARRDERGARAATESPGTRAPEAPPAPPRRPRDRIAPTQGPIALGTMGVLASPSVRRLARERLVDLGQVEGTGRMGRITRQDVLDHIEKQKSKKKPRDAGAAAKPTAEEAAPAATESPGTEAPAPAPPSIEDVDGELMPLSPMRKAVAEHMARSKHVAPHVTTVAEVDMTAAARFRKQYKADHADSDVRLTYTALIANAAIRALHDYPALNASWTDKGIIIRYRIHLGLAVSTEDGLVVPIIRNADRMDLEELAEAIQKVAEKTRAGKVSPSDLGEGTFTITNPGVFGAVISTPIIHQPQAAILATGRIAEAPAVVDGGLAVRKRMYLSLSYDHRIVDGATAVQYLQAVRKILEAADFEVD
jgi:2-oxoglutarate dehydrogenase E2 component (dihydrolipoamide succinyltransferase)